MPIVSRVTSILYLFVAALAPVPTHGADYDVVVYGGTASGVVAAVQGARIGHSVILVEPGRHVGGLTSGGLGATDIGNKGAIGGIAREFYRRVHEHYANDEAWTYEQREDYRSRRQAAGEDTMWTFEPHVAEEILRTMLGEVGVDVLFEERLNRDDGVEMRGGRIRSIAMESGRRLAAKMFIDATYEGDLMAAAGVSYHVGREANSAYGEEFNGVQLGSRKHQFLFAVDPYVRPGEPASGLLPRIQPGAPGEHGAGDHRVQAYCYRMCLTDVPENRVPYPKPDNYDPLQYELALRAIQAGQWDGLGSPTMMPNRKTDTNNNGAFSSDNIGMNYEYPEGDYDTRQQVIDEHISYQQGWLWFLANDPRVPSEVRAEVGEWGLARDEFRDTGNWPHQLYVREARRMVSEVVMTEHHCWGDVVADDPIGLAAYGMDSHNVQRYDAGGRVLNEGDVQIHGFSPFGISYRAIVPRRGECENLLVPICLSASHISYGSIRMEPVFMVLGQSAATAACQAIDAGGAVQDIDYHRLAMRLREGGQVLDWSGPRPRRGRRLDSLAGVVVDDPQAELVGLWSSSRSTGQFIGAWYLHDGKDGQGEKQATFTLRAPRDGEYDLRLAYAAHGNRASNVPVVVSTPSGEADHRIDQRVQPTIEETFVSLGQYVLQAGDAVRVTISNCDANGYVIVDAVQLFPLED